MTDIQTLLTTLISIIAIVSTGMVIKTTDEQPEEYFLTTIYFWAMEIMLVPAVLYLLYTIYF